MIENPKFLIFDIETDGFNPTKIHVLSCCYLGKDNNWSLKTTTDYDEMRKFFSSENSYYIGHNIIRFDYPVVQRLLNITIPKSSKLIDTLTLSWYIFHKRKEHKLESWGETIGIPKVDIENWEDLPIEEYIKRCEEDVKITTNVWVRCFQKLIELYGNSERAYRLIEYLSNKMYAAHLAESIRWKLDVKLCKKNLLFLEQELDSSVSALTLSMPPVLKKNSVKTLKKPNSLYLKSGALSKVGELWLTTLKEFNLPYEHEGDIEINGTYEPPNPKSAAQRKAWLESLGWIPQTFKTVTNKDGTKRDVPQIMRPDGEPCESVIELALIHPEINALLNVGALVHRTAMLRRWLNDVSEDGYLVASIAGLTSTLRFIHAGILNIPKPKIRYGEYIRSCLIAEDSEHELVGSDLKSLETYTKLSMIWPYDKAFVKDELSEDFDGNLSLALCSGAITNDESKFYKWYKNQK